jgi:rod shape determining protein RodA
MGLKKSFRSFNEIFREIDLPLFATTVAICVLSIVNLYGIGERESPFFIRHLVLTIGGLGVMIFFSFITYRYLKNYSIPVLLFYGFGVVLLIITLFNDPIRGARAWITFNGFTLEPSELMKLAVIILMAKYFSQRHIFINQFRQILVSGLYVGIPLGIILLQPDLGSASTLLVIWGGMLLASGINKRHLFLLLGVGIIVSYLSWIFVLKEYQKERLVAFINPYKDPTGIGYNIIQSKIALGSGHWFGTGLGKGSQTTLGFLPEPYNDFVFASFGEQFGFVGIFILCGLYVFLILRILKIGEETDNNFAKLFSIGMALFIFTHVIISASVNIGLMPITGIPFPLMSYGGSHLMSLMIGLGLLHSIRRYG